MDFGTFAVDNGGAISMDNSGALTEILGAIIDFVSSTSSTFNVTLNNSKSALCGQFGFTLSWNPAPDSLTGPGPAMSMTNVTAFEPTYLSPAVALPQTITIPTTDSLPKTVTFRGDLGVSTGQTGGTYASASFSLDLTQAGTTTTISDTISANALTVLTIVETTPMAFGTIASGQSAGTVVLDTSGGRSVTGDAQVISTGPGTSALITITGDGSAQAISVTIDGTGAQLDDVGIGSAMPLGTFTDSGLPTDTGTGTQTFNVGATLSVGALQAAGAYSTLNGNPYSITVNYN